MTALETLRGDLTAAGFQNFLTFMGAALWTHRENPERFVIIPRREPLSRYQDWRARNRAGLTGEEWEH